MLIDEEITLVYGDIKAALSKKGKPSPENDIWIASIAQHHKLAVATRDKHFKETDTVKARNW